METCKIAIIGGGAAGLFLANALANTSGVLLFEKGERLGRKLSATGNGQGNVTNLAVTSAEYFSVQGGDLHAPILHAYDDGSLRAFFGALGVPCLADERGRVYPSGRQASALTDGLRFAIEGKVGVCLQTEITAIERQGTGFLLTARAGGAQRQIRAERVALCAGGKAAKNFGTDGSAYALAKALGHTVTALYPSLVQLKTDTKYTKTLKGIRVSDGVLTARTKTRTQSVQGDIIFTDYGVSGDAVFRLSAFIADELEGKLFIDFLPAYTEGQVYEMLQKKRAAFPKMATGELLFGVVNNQVGRAVLRRANDDLHRAAALVKSFPLTLTGSLGFDYAQVTKGGIPLAELTDRLESKKAKGLYFAGEIVDLDGQCGGFNLQWAYSSAMTIGEEMVK